MPEKEDDIESIKKLPPEVRIKKLKEIEAKRKKEIEDAIKLEQQTQEEMEETEKKLREIPIPQMTAFDVSQLFTREEKEIFRTKRFQGPETKLEEEDAVNMVKKKAGEISELEETIWEAPSRKFESEEFQAVYKSQISQLSKTPAEELYSNAKGMYDKFKEKIWEAPSRKFESEEFQAVYKSQISQLSKTPAEELYSNAKGMYDKFKETGYLNNDEMKQFGVVKYAMEEKERAIESGFYKVAEDRVEEMVDVTKRMMKGMYRK